MKTDENALKRVKASVETFTILEACSTMKMSRPTLVKIMKKKGLKPLQTGRGGKMWLTSKDLETLQNGR